MISRRWLHASMDMGAFVSFHIRNFDSYALDIIRSRPDPCSGEINWICTHFMARRIPFRSLGWSFIDCQTNVRIIFLLPILLASGFDGEGKGSKCGHRTKEKSNSLFMFMLMFTLGETMTCVAYFTATILVTVQQFRNFNNLSKFFACKLNAPSAIWRRVHVDPDCKLLKGDLLGHVER